MGKYLEQAGYIDEGIVHIQDYVDHGVVYETPLKQSIGTTLLGPEVFSTDMPTYKATPLTEPRRTRPNDLRAYSDSQLRARESNHRSSTLADLQNYRIRDTLESMYCDQAATPFQQIKPYDDQQTRTSQFLKREGEKECVQDTTRKRQITVIICRRGLFLDRICQPLQYKQEIHPRNVDCYLRHCLRQHLQGNLSGHLNR